MTHKTEENTNRPGPERLQASLIEYYSEDKAWEAILPFIHPKQQAPISLRLLDYFVVTFSHIHDTHYNIVGSQGEVPFYVYSQYRTQLKRYTKARFDPFCRGVKQEFRGCKTNWKQLNFFRWAITHHVIDYAVAHLDEISEAHKADVKPEEGLAHKRHRGKPTEALSVRCYVYGPDQHVTVAWETTPVPVRTFEFVGRLMPSTDSRPPYRPAIVPAKMVAMSGEALDRMI